MANYISDPKNLFSNDDDVDDDTFLRSSKRNPDFYNRPQTSEPVDRLELQRQKLIEKKKDIEQQTIKSTQRSLGLLYDSEDVGIETAKELKRQREKLENTDKRLDEINSTLRFSQKHLTSIKSIFGGLKNYLSGQSTSTPTMRRNTNPFVDDASTSMPTSASSHFSNENATNPFKQNDQHYLERMKNDDTTRGGSVDAQAIIDRNLQEMLGNVTRLKGMASELSGEIVDQNYLIDNINDKAARADITLNQQNRDLQKLLRK